MRLYEFKKADPAIDTVVVTDGCNDQKRVFVTETPRNANAEIQAMGFNFQVGESYMHEEFVDFATKNGLQLLVHHQGIQTEIEEVVSEPED